MTAEDLTLYFLSRIRQHDERLRTYLELNPRALDEARASDARRKAGRLLGPFDGIPVSLKDNIETAAPMHTTAGAEILLDNIAAQDAPLVAQLRARGAVILGKANLSEFAGVVSFGQLNGGFTAVGGQTVNPHGHYPTSGSSSGSAAGVAATLALVSVGSETSGSLIGPSAWNGVVGMKPSRALRERRRRRAAGPAQRFTRADRPQLSPTWLRCSMRSTPRPWTTSPACARTHWTA